MGTVLADQLLSTLVLLFCWNDYNRRQFFTHSMVQSMCLHHPRPLMIENWFLFSKQELSPEIWTRDLRLRRPSLPTLPRAGWIPERLFFIHCIIVPDRWPLLQLTQASSSVAASGSQDTQAVGDSLLRRQAARKVFVPPPRISGGVAVKRQVCTQCSCLRLASREVLTYRAPCALC